MAKSKRNQGKNILPTCKQDNKGHIKLIPSLSKVSKEWEIKSLTVKIMKQKSYCIILSLDHV